MKLMLCGKGGCGKSTVTALLAKEYARQGKRVLVIDCDESNYGLHQQLGLELPKDFTDFVGGKQRIMMLSANGPMNVPPLFEGPMTLDDIPKDYLSEHGGIMLLSPGKIVDANEGCACAFNIVMFQFLQFLQLGENDVVIMDMEAGVEHFGRGTGNSCDAVLIALGEDRRDVRAGRASALLCAQQILRKSAPGYGGKNRPSGEDRLSSADERGSAGRGSLRRFAGGRVSRDSQPG